MMSGTSATAARDDVLPHGPKQRHRRARTGCERCRAQHRKCDEGKPQCRRCIDAGAACKYIAHISFLEKNSQTLPNNVTSRLSPSSATPEYRVLEFVINEESSTQWKASSSSSTSTVAGFSRQPEEQRNDFEIVPKPRHVILADNAQAQSEDGNLSFQQGNVQTVERGELINTEDVSYRNLSSSSAQTPTSFESDNRWPLAGRSPLSSDEIGLLKYYNHHVAPWLDIYDQSQTFGQLVTQVAMNSPCVLVAVLELSAVFSGRPKDMVKHRGVSALYFQAMSRPIFDLRLLVSYTLVRTLILVRAVPDTWESILHRLGPWFDFNGFHPTNATQQRIWLSSHVLILRLEMAYYLINQTAPVMISGLLSLIPSPPTTYEASVDQSQKILDFSLYCLKLLTSVMTLCLPIPEVADSDATPSQDAVSTLTSGVSRVARWKQLIDGLQIWRRNRPPELQPLIEVEEGHNASTFPTVIFPTGAGISANTLYHTAMLLLLSNKPQSISLAEWQQQQQQHGNSVLDDAAAATAHMSLSPLWHARRVCGIALNSDPEHTHCWDPCMIAAFSLAARRMTHPSQQHEVLACLGRVKMAGWHVDGLVKRLRDEWGLIEFG